MDARELKSRQAAAVIKMLNLNGPAPSSAEQWSDQWKVLVYDSAGRDIISPLLNVAQLRRNGITLHMLLDSDREAIPDVPAIYFCRPTAANIQRIARDCSGKLYASMHLNFISKIERRLMEDLARLVVESGAVPTIARVFDQQLDFVTLEPRLFTLNHRNSYLAYNGSDQSEEGIQQAMSSMTYGLFSVLATQGAMPIIRAPRNGPSEMVARQLSDMVAQAWSGGASAGPFAETGSTPPSRPLVVILDRALDLATALRHTCTYQALVGDVLDYRMNRVNAEGKSYDLEVEQDGFWKKNAPRPFPEAIDDNSNELGRIKELEKEIKEKTAGGGGGEAAEAAAAPSEAAEGGGTQELLATVDSLPKLLERKKKLESHTNILQAAMQVIAARDLPIFFEAETADRTDKDKLLSLLGTSSKGTLSDKLRLLAVLNLRAADASSAPLLTELEEALSAGYTEAPAEVTAELEAGLQAIKHLRQVQQMASFTSPKPSQAEGAASSASGWLVSKVSATLGQVQSMLAQSNDTYVTRVVDNLCEFKAGSEDDSFLALDPRSKEPPTGPGRPPFREVIVFMIGGGSYSEYQLIQDYSKRHPERQLTYGCTELISGSEFLKQLGSL